MSEPLHIKGECNVDELSEDERNRLVSVEGDLYAVDFVNLSLPNLQSVGNYLDVFDADNLSLPKLQSVGGTLLAVGAENLSLPALQFVGKEFLTDTGTRNLTIPFDLAMEKGVPVECLAEETLQQGVRDKEAKNQRTQNRGVK